MDDLKAIYSVIVWNWQFIKEYYLKNNTTDDISHWIDVVESKHREILKDDVKLAWLFRKMAMVSLEFLSKAVDEKNGAKNVWDLKK